MKIRKRTVKPTLERKNGEWAKDGMTKWGVQIQDRRFRHGQIPDHREPKHGRVSALEKVMRTYADRKSGHVVAPEIGREFDSLAEAFDFYNLYSWEIGFGIRYGQCRRNAQKSRTVQDIVCGCAMGKAKKRKHKFLGIQLPSIDKAILHPRQWMKLQFDRDAEENFAEKKSRLVSPVLKSGLPLERHAGKVYTPALFKLFQEACFKSASYYVENILAVNDTYCVTHLYADQREAWSKTSYNVKVQEPDNYLQCECGMYEHMGLLCCHAIRVMAHLRFTKIPERNIMRRWTKEACEDLPEYLKIYKGRSPILGSTTFRHTALYTTALDIVRMGDSNPEAFEFAMSKLSDAMVGLKEKANGLDDKGLEDILDKEKIDMQ
ncbi:hypothetical protein D1007_06128 [Hordeum vulgare]|nr:hypothetical protein D1007_06128 [Hordeum vulgare]